MIGVFIPEWHPATVNQLLRNRWAATRLKKRDRQIVWAYTARSQAAEGKRRVYVTVVLKPGQRAADPDSQWKSTLDALVHAGMLLDDNRQHVELTPVLFERSPRWGTVIRLEDL